MALEVPFDPALGPGTWNVGDVIYFKCPEGHIGVLHPEDHDIGRDGVVRPSVVCPHHDCQFHEFIQLLNWREPSRVRDSDG